MTLFEFALKILESEDLESKLTPVEEIEWNESEIWQPLRFDSPMRDKRIAFSKEQMKFPKKEALKQEKERGKALHFFANHELLAIEMMAQAILLFPELSLAQRKLLISTLSEEQKHFSLYRERMEDLGVSFGDYPLNDFFWSYMKKVSTPSEFFAVISLTFEQANLDFAKYYGLLFKEFGDEKTASLMNEVYEDEIKHVSRGRHEVNKYSSHDLKSIEASQLWEFYCSVLPEPLTPARAKGIIFDQEGRRMAGLPPEFIQNLEDYRNDFAISQRRQWKK